MASEQISPTPGAGEKPSAFISYGRADAADLVARLEHDLGEDYDLLYDSKLLQAGAAWDGQLEVAIRNARAIIAVLTPHAVRRAENAADHSDSVCHNEIEVALGAKVPIIPVVWKKCATPFRLNHLHRIDFEFLDYSAAVAKLRAELAKLRPGGHLLRRRAIDESWSLLPSFQFVLSERSVFFGRQWLFDRNDGWLAKPGAAKLLLITGMTGSGKSSIMTKVIRDQPCGRVLAYHFCRYNDENTLKPLGFIRNLAYMLDQQLPDYHDALTGTGMQNELALLNTDSPDENPVALFERTILTPLKSITPPDLGGQPGWIVVDALDEAVRFAARRGDSSIVDLIKAELHRLPSWLRVLATCRPGNDAATQLVGQSESGQPNVSVLQLDQRSSAADFDDCIEQRFAAAGKPLPSESTRAIIRLRSDRSFQYCMLLLDRLIDGDWSEDDIRRAPPNLHAFYRDEFARFYGRPPGAEFLEHARPMLSAVAVARQPLSMDFLAEAAGLEKAKLHAQRQRLAGFLVEREGSIEFAHKSVSDWILNDAEALEYALNERQCHKHLADFCWRLFKGLHGVVNIVRLEDEETTAYMVRHGVTHFLGAGQIARAVELLHFIVRNWDEKKIADSSFASVSPEWLTRTLLHELDRCSDDEKRAIAPSRLADLIKNFYQVEPLGAPLDVLIRYHAAVWPDLLKQLLAAENYVLRFRASDMLAEACIDPESPIQIEDIYAYLDSDDINVRELGAYTVRRVYAQQPERVRLEYLERLADSETYPARSALGDLLLNLAFRKDGYHYLERISSKRFREPIWDHIRLDIWDLQAAKPFMANQPLPPDADAGTRAAYDNFRNTKDLRRTLLAAPEIKADRVVQRLIKDFRTLGCDLDQITRAEAALRDHPQLENVMRLLFSHPLWNVAETAASVLTSIAERDERRKAVIGNLLKDDYWRVRFGAIEAAYQLVYVDRTLFEAAVGQFHAHPNSRVRALCAEDLVAYILDRAPRQRADYLKRFQQPISRWIEDTDCWVLEHVFRLLKTLARDGYDCSVFFPSGMPPLLEGLDDWANLTREKFLAHIEARKERL